jgi:hypothetical protein
VQNLLCSVILLFSTIAFAQSSAPNSSSLTTTDLAQLSPLLTAATGSSTMGQATNALALAQGLMQLTTDLKKIPDVTTTITEDAAKLDSKFMEIRNHLETLEPTLASALLKSSADIPKLIASITAFEAQKKACIKSAEASSNMCVEGTSQGAVKVKALMTLAGPALSLISSAQKACSSTAQLADFASKGLTIAKGVCAAAKAMCDSTCGTTSAQLTKLIAEMESFNLQAIQEILDREEICTATIVSPDCAAVFKAKVEIGNYFATLPVVKLKSELIPANPGTTGKIVAGCAANIKDLLLLGANVAALALSKSGADKCSDALKGATGTTTAQYCEMSANASTQFCQCKNNNAAQGCPGYVATTATPPPPKTDDPGNDLKTSGSGNQFASGNNPIVPTSPFNGSGGLGPSNPTTDDSKKDKAPNPNGLGGLSSGGNTGSGNAGGSGAAPGSDSAAAEKNLAGEKKKWSFGSFLGGFGSGSGGSSSDSKSLKLGKKDMDALKRQIASEQIRSEVSEASGKSNWEKVRERYLSNSPSLLNGQ